MQIIRPPPIVKRSLLCVLCIGFIIGSSRSIFLDSHFRWMVVYDTTIMDASGPNNNRLQLEVVSSYLIYEGGRAYSNWIGVLKASSYGTPMYFVES